MSFVYCCLINSLFFHWRWWKSSTQETVIVNHLVTNVTYKPCLLRNKQYMVSWERKSETSFQAELLFIYVYYSGKKNNNLLYVDCDCLFFFSFIIMNCCKSVLGLVHCSYVCSLKSLPFYYFCVILVKNIHKEIIMTLGRLMTAWIYLKERRKYFWMCHLFSMVDVESGWHTSFTIRMQASKELPVV